MEEHGVILKIKADFEAAKAAVQSIVEKAKELRKAKEEAGIGASGQASAGNPLTPPPEKADSPKKHPASSESEKPERKSSQAVKEEGKSVGEAIGHFFVTYVLQKGSAYLFDMARDPLRSNAGLVSGQRATGGAIMGGMAGMQLGRLAGVPGMAVGAALGAGVGGGLGWLSGEREGERTTRVARYRQDLGGRNQQLSDSLSLSDEAFSRSLPMMTRLQRIGELQNRMRAIESGAGGMSIAAIQAKMFEYQKGNMTDQPAYQELEGRLAVQRSRDSQLRLQMHRETWQPAVGLAGGSEFADAYQRRGFFAGASVNAESVNTRIVDILEEIKDALLETSRRGVNQEVAPYAGNGGNWRP